MTDPRGYESRDAAAAPLVKFLILLAAVSMATFLIVAAMFAYLESRERRAEPLPSPMGRQVADPRPLLQDQPGRELERVRAREERSLQSYGWVDSQQGIARIPIDRAIDLVAEQGLPHREGPQEEGQ